MQLHQMEQLLAVLAFATMVSPFDGECQEAWEGEGGWGWVDQIAKKKNSCDIY